jgi:hypothetical protein
MKIRGGIYGIWISLDYNEEIPDSAYALAMQRGSLKLHAETRHPRSNLLNFFFSETARVYGIIFIYTDTRALIRPESGRAGLTLIAKNHKLCAFPLE